MIEIHGKSDLSIYLTSRSYIRDDQEFLVYLEQNSIISDTTTSLTASLQRIRETKV